MLELKKAGCEVFPVIVPHKSTLKSINFFLVKQGTSLSLIDAGWDDDDCWYGLQSTLNVNGFALNDLTEIILTHHHIDHIGLVNRITAEHPIPVYAHPNAIHRLKRDKDFLNMRVEFFTQLYQEMGCGKTGDEQIAYLTKALSDHKQRALQAEIHGIHKQQLLHFNIIDLPGHSPDQIGFYDEKQNWLFAGDLLIEHISSNAIVEPDVYGNRLPTLSQHIDSLKKCRALNVGLVFPGHGTLIENPNALIDKRLERMKAKGGKTDGTDPIRSDDRKLACPGILQKYLL